jgi:alkylhydroperoxidase family enzyme
VTLARATCTRPARLVPADLDHVRALVGDAALDYLLVMGAFHFINRIADLLDVDPEFPTPLRRFELSRRLMVRLASHVMARLDLAPRAYPTSAAEAIARIAPRLPDDGRQAAAALAPLVPRPQLIEVLHLALEERDVRSSLDRPTLARVHRAVDAALPAGPAEADGFHTRPADPVEAFAFVGTRYAHRTTLEMVDALRRAGFDDLGLLDLATAVADANQWARLHRLTGLAPDLFSLAADRPAPARAAPGTSSTCSP